MRARWLIGAALIAAVVTTTGTGGGAQSPARDVRLTLTEGTSMAAALSPDGRTIALDLLGALWTMPSTGGRATRVLDDGYDAHAPAWSPDGTRLAFQAYYRDTWNIWTMKADGSELRQVTSGAYDDREPHWSPDGTRIAFASDRGGNYDVWLLTLASGGVQRVTAGGANESMPAWSPDGAEIAFVSDREPRGIYARHVDTGVERQLAAETAVLYTPSWAPDGKTVAYVAVEGAVTRLMAGGTNVADASEDVHPFRASWASASELLYTADGGVKRRALAGAARPVPFAAEVAFTRPAFTPAGRAFPPEGPQPVLGLMHPTISPDGATVAFAALGDLWLVATRAGDGVPRRVTNDVFVETNPVWSPDGTTLAYSSDRDGAVALWARDLASGGDRRIAGDATTASWSPDGSQLAYLDSGSQLRVVRVANREQRQVHGRLFEPGRPSWSPDGRAVVMSALRPYSTRFREGTNQVLWVAVQPDVTADGKAAFAPDRWIDPIPHKSVGMRENLGPVWAPNGREMAAVVDGQLTTYPVARDGTPTGPPRRISTDLASSPSWTSDSRRVLYQTADRFRLADLADGSIRDIVPQWSWTAKTAAATTTTIHAGRLFDSRAGATAQTDMDVVIEGRRIVSVSPHRDSQHRGTVLDASAGTVLPGLIESHAHLSKALGEAQGRIWLAFGVTTVRNPATNAFEGQEEREAIEAGVRVGPRVITTGEPLDGSRIYYPGGVALDGGGLVEAQLARARTLRFDFIKTYVRLPDLLQKRIIEGAHRAGLPVTSHEIYPAVVYGADGVEHVRGTSRRGYSPKTSLLSRSYSDVVQLLTASGMTLTPTITIQGGFPLLTARDPWWVGDPRVTGLFPASVAAAGQAMRAKPLVGADLAAREAAVSAQERLVLAVVRGGGRVIAGTDSPINPYGVALLSELEHYVRGGLSPADAIRTATAVPAEAFGLGADLGTIAAGKLADLVIVDGDPLTTITDLRRTRWVVKDGVIYDVATLLKGPVVP